MYKIIGGDGKEYGPSSAEEIRQWITEGRANGQTLVQREGERDWMPLSSFRELASPAAAPPLAPHAPETAGAQGGIRPLPETAADRDYEINVNSCFSRGWELLTSQFGLLFGGSALWLLIQAAFSAASSVPVLGALVSLASMVVHGPLWAGLIFLNLKALRGELAEVGDIFAGFRFGFAQLVLGTIVMTLITLAVMIPGGLLAALVAVTGAPRGETLPPLQAAMLLTGIFVALLPAVYLNVCWFYALPLILDKRLDFWPAMELSRKLVQRRWWKTFGLILAFGVLCFVGMLFFVVGLFFTLPLGMAAIAHAYEDAFTVPVEKAAG